MKHSCGGSSGSRTLPPIYSQMLVLTQILTFIFFSVDFALSLSLLEVGNTLQHKKDSEVAFAIPVALVGQRHHPDLEDPRGLDSLE